MPRMQRFEPDLDKRDLTTLQLKLRQHTLLLPSACIAEINIAKNIEIREESQPWIYGYYRWHDLSIPLLDLEGMILDIERLKNVRYVAILYSQTSETATPFYAMILQEAPVFYSIEHGDLQIIEMRDAKKNILSSVQMEENIVYIPNMIAMEELFAPFYKSPQRL